jgi:cupredoxin-like protein
LNALLESTWEPGSAVRTLLFTIGLALAATAAVPEYARAQEPEITIVIRNHRFEPAEVRVPANKRITITVINDDPTPEEFESIPLKVEKIIQGKSKATIRIGPLKPGRYKFFGEFNEATAQGVVIAE